MKWKNPLIPIMLIIFVDVLGLGILLPVLPYFATAYSATPFEVGLLMSAFPAAMLIGAPVLGRLSDRHGRKPLLIASLFGTFAGYVLLAVANSLPVMFVARLIDGFTGGNIPIAQAYIADVVDEKKRAQAYGMIGATFGMGYIFGPAIGGLAAGLGKQIGIGYALPALVAAFFALVSMVLTYFVLPDSRKLNRDVEAASREHVPFAEAARRVFSARALAMALVVTFLYTLGVQFYYSQGALFSQTRFGYDELQTGLLIAYAGVINAIMQAAIVGRVVGRIGEQRTVTVGSLILAAGLFAVGASPTPFWLFVATTITSVGFALLIASLISLVTQLARPSERGMVLGVSTSVTALANALSPALGGALFGAFGASAPMWLGGVLLLICTGLALGMPRTAPSAELEPQPAETGR